MLESSLFGTTKGSYTGAENKPGLFEIANGGTLFLDEINSMDISVQPKLLRAIEEKRVCRLGSYKPLEVDVKIVAAKMCIRDRNITEHGIRENIDIEVILHSVEVFLISGKDEGCLLYTS